MISEINVFIADKYYYRAKGKIDFATRRQIIFSHIHGYISRSTSEILCCCVQFMSQLKAKLRLSIAGQYYI